MGISLWGKLDPGKAWPWAGSPALEGPPASISSFHEVPVDRLSPIPILALSSAPVAVALGPGWGGCTLSSAGGGWERPSLFTP